MHFESAMMLHLWIQHRHDINYRVPQKYRLKVYGSEGHKNGANQHGADQDGAPCKP